MKVLLDAGGFIALERGDAMVTAIVKQQIRRGTPPVTHGGIVGQVWRNGARQARLAGAVALCIVAPLDTALGRRAGELLARARRSDVIDAALIVLAGDGDAIITSDPVDLSALADSIGLHVELVQT